MDFYNSFKVPIKVQHERKRGEKEEERRTQERSERGNVIANELCIVSAPREGGRWEANCFLAAAKRQVRIFEPPNDAAN